MSLRYRYNLNSSKSVSPDSESKPDVSPSKKSHSKHLSTHQPKSSAATLSKPAPPITVTTAPLLHSPGFQKFTASEIKRLGQRFMKLDSDHSGTISLKEFLKIPEISKNVLANRIVQVFDANQNGEVDFREFVLGMSQFSGTENVEGRLRFAFRIYDIDGNGYISNGELFQVLKCMVGSNLTDIQIQEAVDHTFMIGDTDHDGQISFNEFAALVKNHDKALKSVVLHGI